MSFPFPSVAAFPRCSAVPSAHPGRCLLSVGLNHEVMIEGSVCVHGRKELGFRGFSFFPGCACLVHTNVLSSCELRGVALCGVGVEWSPVFRIMIRFSRRANKESRFCGVSCLRIMIKFTGLFA